MKLTRPPLYFTQNQTKDIVRARSTSPLVPRLDKVDSRIRMPITFHASFRGPTELVPRNICRTVFWGMFQWYDLKGITATYVERHPAMRKRLCCLEQNLFEDREADSLAIWQFRREFRVRNLIIITDTLEFGRQTGFIVKPSCLSPVGCWLSFPVNQKRRTP